MPPRSSTPSRSPKLVDDLVGGLWRHLGGVGVGDTADVTRVLDRRPLEPVADPEERDPARARDFHGLHHAAGATVAEASGHQDAVGAVERPLAVLGLQRLGLDPLHVDLEPVMEAAVEQRFGEALVRVLEPHVLADDVDRDLVLRVLDAVQQRFPQAGRPRLVGQRQLLQDDAVDAFLGERERHFVDARRRRGAVMTASSLTSQKSAILRLMSRGSVRSVRHSRMSG